jgi:flagellar hook-basal body complex protein FliE
MQTASLANTFASPQLAASDSFAALSGSPAASGQPSFAGLLKNAIGGVQSLEDQAADTVQGLVSGQGVDIHQAMIATQKADLSFEMALAVRSKAVAAYQQIMQMQF